MNRKPTTRSAASLSVIAILLASTLLFAAAGAAAPRFGFVDSVQEFFGFAPTGTTAPIVQTAEPLEPMFSTAVSITSLGTAFTQNFNTLPASGSPATWTNDSTIDGWYHARTGTGTTIVVNDGTSNAGNLYSYGTGTASDRAIGSLGSGNASAGNFFWGERLINNTGSTITSLAISYNGEQWTKNNSATTNTIAFSYLVGSPTVTGSLAEFQSAGVAVTGLNFTSPIVGATTLAALDGNAAANRTVISFTITGLSIPDGTEVMLRWSDPDHSGSDHGLAIDDLSITALSAPVITSSGPTTATEGVQYSYNPTLTDPDDSSWTWSLLSDTCGGLIISGTGAYTFTPATPTPPASCVVGIRVCDDDSQCASQTTTVNITPTSEATNHFRSRQDGFWGTADNWESSPDGNDPWITATLTPTSAANTITVRNGHTVTVAANVAADQVTIATGGVVAVNGGSALTVDDGTGVDLTVNGTFNCGTSTVTGAGDFTVASGGTLGIGSTAGITTGASGNIQTTTRNFSTGANYTYNGSAAQVTGNGLPSTIANLTIANSAGLTLSQAVSPSSLTLTSGNITTTTPNLLFVTGSTVGAVSGGSAGSYVNGPFARNLPGSLATGTTYLLPIGKGSYNPLELIDPTTTTGGDVRGEVFDANSGGTAGTGLGSLKTNRYWRLLNDGENISGFNTAVRLTDSTVAAGNLVGHVLAASPASTYNSIGGSVSSGTITSNVMSGPGINGPFGFFNIGVPPPTITTSVTSLTNFGSHTVGNYSPIQSYTVSGANLTADIAIAAPTHFEISLSPTSGFGGSLNLTQSGGTVATTTIYARFAPTAAASFGANIQHTSTGATQKNVGVAGTGVAAVCTAPPANMVAWYAAENNALDKQGPIFENGTLQNGATFAAGKVGQTFTFDGTDDYVSVPDSAALRPANLTVDGWFKFDNAGATQVLAQKTFGTGTTESWSLFYLNSGQLGVALSSTGILAAPFTPEVGAWYHIAFTYDSGSVLVYLNGQQFLTASGAGIAYDTHPVLIGAAIDNEVVGNFFDGSVDEFEIFSRALTATEVANIYNAGSAGKCNVCTTAPSGMTMWHRAEGNANDILGNYHGTAVGSPTYTAGKVGQAYNLNGTNQYVQLPGTFGGPALTELTIDAWVKSNGDNGQFQAIVSSTGFDFVHLQLFNGGSIAVHTTGGTGVTFNALPPAQFTTWRHIALVLKSGDSHLYVDGAANQSSAGTFTFINQSSDVRIGAGASGFRHFPGQIDEVEIFNRALTQSEIQAIYNAGTAGKCQIPDMTMNKFGDPAVILDGSTTTSTTNGTNFGPVDVTSGTANSSFNIGNQGEVGLTFSGSPHVQITGPDASDFTVTQQPLGPIAPGNERPDIKGPEGSSQPRVDILFNPSAAGLRTATVTIGTNDPDEDPFDFVIQGTGTVPEPNTTVTLTSGNLVIEDTNGGNTNDAITIACSGGNITITDAGAGLSESIPVASVTGSITINTFGGNDAVTINLSGCDFINDGAGGGLFFNGGAGGTDSLTVTGGSSTTITHTASSPNDGTIAMAGGSTTGVITYTGLEPVTDNMSAVDRVFTFTGGAETITVTDGAAAADGITRIDSTLSELIDFTNPTNSTTINAGSGNDTINITSVDAGFNKNLTINGDDGGDVTNFNSDLAFASGFNLDVDMQNDVATPGTDGFFLGSGANLVFAGSGAATVRVSGNVSLASNSTFESVNGNIIIEANQQTTPTSGTFNGILLTNAGVLVSGTGTVTMNGRGGDTGNSNRGVYVVAGSVVRGGNVVGSTTTDVQGFGGPTGGNDRHGVQVDGVGSTITSMGGNVRVRGTGGGGTGSDRYGVIPIANGTITSGGNGNVLVEGTGGTASGGNNNGVIVHQDNGNITSGGTGTVTVTGTGGTGSNSFGVFVFRNGRINSGGAGAVNVTGTGSGGVRVFTDGAAARINSGGGPITVTGTAASGGFGIHLASADAQIQSGANADITLIADSMVLNTSTSLVSAGTGTVNLRQKTNAVQIRLGGATDSFAGPLDLVDLELDKVTAGTLNIGDSNSGAVSVSAAITQTGKVTNIASPATTTVTSTGSLGISGTVTGALTVNTTGELRPGTSPGIINSGNLTLSTGSTYFAEINGTTVGTQYDQLNVTGTVDLGGATLSLSGTHTPTPGQTFTIINNDSTDAITGTFTGLPTSGSVITNFLGSTYNASINYQGGSDSNDVVLTVLTPTITVTASLANFGPVTVGNFSAPQSYTVSGANLAGTLDIAATPHFQIATLPSGPWGTNLGFSPSGGTVSPQTIYVRFAPTGVGVLGINITHTSTSATPQDLAVAGTGVAAVCTAPPSGMQAWYRAESDARDSQGPTAQHGTLQNGATFATGKVGQAFSLDGTNDHVSMADSPIWDLGTADFTIDSWINTPGVTATPQRILSAGIESGPNQMWTFGIVDTGGHKLNFAYWTGSGYVDFFSTPLTIVPNQWYHVAVVRSGTAMTFYLNGAAVGGGTIGAAVPLDSDNVTNLGGMIGARRNTTFSIYEFANGKLDEIELFNTALTATDIANIYNAGTAGKCTAPEMDVTGNSVSIADNDATPSLADHTDFGSTGESTGSVTRTFTIENSGTATLNLTDTTPFVTVGGTNASEFTVTAAPGSAIFSLGATVFDVTFNPAGLGTRSATLSIANSDSDENPYNFSIQGTGTGSTGVVLSGSDLIVSDDDGGSSNDTLTVSIFTGPVLRVRDPSNTLTCGAGITQVDANTCDTPLASVTGTIFVNTLGGTDSLTVNYDTGGILLPISYDGGAGSDSLTVSGGSPFASVTHTLNSASSGSVAPSGLGTITYTGLEPVTDNLSAVDRVFTFTGGTETITVTDAAAAGVTRIDSTLSELVDFTNPTNSLTINAGTGDDTVTVASVDSGLNKSLTVNGDAGNDTVNLNADITFASNFGLDVNLANDATAGDVDAVSFGASANLLLSGTGSAAVGASQSVTFLNGSSLVTVNGNNTVNANQQLTPTTGNFIGVDLSSAVVQATGTGVVTVNGKGGTSGGNQHGVRLTGSGSLIKGGNAAGLTTSVTGTGGAGSSTTNLGVLLTGGGLITSFGGNVSVTGTGGSGTGGDHHGVRLFTTGTINAEGSGTVTVFGTGGTAAAGGCFGVDVRSPNAAISSSGGSVGVTGQGGACVQNTGINMTGGGTAIITSGGGPVTVTGTGGNGGSNNDGINMYRSSQITATGSGNVIVEGTGGNGSDSEGVQLLGDASAPAINSSGGTISVTGTSTTSIGLLLGNASGNNCGAGCSIASGSNAAVTLIADSMALATGTTTSISAGTGAVTLRQKTNSVAIGLGAATDPSAGPLNLTDAEIDRITAGTLNIGNANSGAISFSGAVPIDVTDAPSIGALNLTGGSSVDSNTTGGVRDVTASTLSVTSAAIGGPAAPLETDAVTLTTSTTGVQELSEANTVTVGAAGLSAPGVSINLHGGRFNTAVGGNMIANSVIVRSGAIVGGVGSLSTTGSTSVQSGGSVAPGTSPGILNSGVFTFNSGSTFSVELNGLTPGSGHDQLNATGNVALGNATLSLSSTFSPTAGQTFTIINNVNSGDDTTGTFNGIADGSTISNVFANGYDATINYNGGTDSNDVVLTAALPPSDVVVSTASLADFGSHTVGNYSATQTYNVSGSSLTANIDVTAPTHFEVSLLPGGPFSSSVSIPFGAGTVNPTPVYVRFAPGAAGTLGGNVTNASTGAATENVAVTGTGVAAVCTAPPTNMVAWYRGETNANDHIGGNNGTFTAATYVAGKVGQAFDLDGADDYVEIPDSPSFNTTHAVSIDAWVKLDSVSGTRGVVSKYNSTLSSTAPWVMWLENGKLTFQVSNGSPGNYRYVVSNTALSVGTLTHVAGTFDPVTQDVKVYINGVDELAPLGVGSSSVSTLIDNTTPVHIGAYNAGAAVLADKGLFDGVVDEVEIFNRTLTPTEIANIYNASTAGKCPPPTIVADAASVTVNEGTIAHNSGTFSGEPGNTINITASTGTIEQSTSTWTLLQTIPTANQPGNPALDNQGNLYVVHGNAGGPIKKYNPAGAEIGSFTLTYQPGGIVIDNTTPNRLFITALSGAGANNIYAYDLSGNLLGNLGITTGSGDGQLNTPYNIAQDAAGLLYVVDRGNERVEVFNTSGVFQRKWGSLGAANGQFNFPQGIRVAPNGNVYVVDRGNNRIQYFTSLGAHLGTWGSFGAADGQFNVPTDVSIDAGGNAFVSDFTNNRVQKFSPTGTFLDKLVGLNGPHGVAFPDGGRSIYIANYNIDNVVKYASPGTWTWSASALDGNAGPTTVTITASDVTNGTSSNTTFPFTINNVAPTIALTGNATVNWYATYTLNLGAITDPGVDTVTAYSVDWGDGVVEPFVGVPSGTKNHVYSTQGVKNIAVSLTDEDGTFPTAGTKAVTVGCNAAPVVLNNANSGVGSLRQAVLEACAGATITFDAGVVSPISLSTGQITIDKNLTIDGPGANLLTVQNTQAVGATSRAFIVNSGVTATIQDLTISGGNISGGDQSTGGGGIHNSGVLTIERAVISGNTVVGAAGPAGGAIFNATGATVNFNNGTVSGNTGWWGGGIRNIGTFNAFNSTFNGNSGTNLLAGAFWNSGMLSVTSSTISGNSGAAQGGGIYNEATANVRNSIVAGNAAASNPDIRGGFTDQGFNLIGGSPLLAALQNNGGPTSTMRPLPGSPAIDKGHSTTSVVDQRGSLRPVDLSDATYPQAVGGDGADIGAYEVQAGDYDTTQPTVTTIDDGDTDDIVNVGTMMTYTITFNEDIDHTTVSAADFDNAGTSAITIGTITETTATSGIFTVQVTPTTAGTLILRIPAGAIIRDGSFNPLATPVQDDTTVTVQNVADLTITKSDSQDPVTVDNPLTYTINVSNAGPQIATDVQVVDTLPADVTFVSATSSQGSCSGTTTVTCNLGTINNGASATVTITVRPTPAAGGSTLSNTATVTTTSSDPNVPNMDTETTAVVAAVCVAPPSGAVARWQADGDLTDSQGPTFENASQAGSGGVGFVSGRSGQAFSFNGSNWLDAGSPAPLVITGNAVSMEAWVNPTNAGGDRILFGRSLSGANSYVMFLWGGALSGGVSTNVGSETFVNTGQPLPINTWSHIAMVYDGSTITIYLNGVSVGSTPKTGAITDTGVPFTIGGRGAGGSFINSVGAMDEVQIYDRPLSASEVNSRFNGGPVSGMAAWYKGQNDATDQFGVLNGTMLNGAGFAGGKVGQAFTFDGVNDHVRVNDSTGSPLDFTTALTIDAWVNAGPLGVQAGSIVGKYQSIGGSTDPLRHYVLYIDTSTRQLVFRSNGTPDLYSTNSIPLSEWTHVAVTFSSTGQAQLYINGQPDGPAVNATGALNPNNVPLTIGSSEGGAFNTFLNGLVDEVQLFNRALSQAEIAAIYNASTAGKCVAPEVVVEEPVSTDLTDNISTSNFGSTIVGQAGTIKTYTVRNRGTTTLNVGAITIDGANPGDFVLNTSGMSPSIAPNGNTAFTVQFMPSAGGVRTANLHIPSDDADENPFDVALTGTGLVPGTLSFKTAPYTDSETNADHTFTVTVQRTIGSDGIVGVTYATSAGTATAGADYTETTNTLSWGDGDTADKTFNVTVKGDTVYEANETVNLTLSAATGSATIGTPNPTTLTITNDDAVPATVVVNTTADTDDGFCLPLGQGNGCTLREAMDDANQNGDATTVNFGIPNTDPGFAGGVYTIQPTAALPMVSTAMTINGPSQTTFGGDTNANGPEVVVNGSLSGGGLTAFHLTGTAIKIVQGLVVNGYGAGGAAFGGAASNYQILDNYVGTNASGTAAVANNGGLGLGAGSGNMVSGNLISGNTAYGISTCDVNNSTFTNNKIGTDRTGTSGVGNGAEGFSINCINGNNNTISSNTIAFNGTDGLRDAPDYPTTQHFNNKFTQNSIFSNGEQGIDLWPGPGDGNNDGVTANDNLDVDAGANNLQNFPVITAAYVSGSTRAIRGTLNTTASSAAGYTVEFFANAACDSPGGNGEGQTYLGSITTSVTNASGDVTPFVFNPATLTVGQFITATATDSLGNTSEFSQCFAVTTGVAGTIEFALDPYSVAENAGPAVITVTRTGGTQGAVTATFDTSNGTATSGSDYTAVTGFVVSFADGVGGNQTINVPLLNDGVFENDETVNLSLSNTTVTLPNGESFTAPSADSAVLTITNDEACVTNPVVTINADSGVTSLRQAVLEACAGSTITFAAGPIPGEEESPEAPSVTSPISLSTGQIVIDKNVTITGPGASLLTVQNTQAQSPTSRIFTVSSGVTATVSGLTITGGNTSTAHGGAINNDGTLTLTNTVVTGNNSGSTTAYGGGGIANQGTLNLNTSTVSNNTAMGGGGGLLMINGGTTNITGSTFSGNTGNSSGAILAQSITPGGLPGTLTVANSTISGNTAIPGTPCGGIWVLGTLSTANITSTTITNNTGTFAGGICGSGGTATVRNSIIAGNVNNSTVPDVDNTFTSQGYNLIGNVGTAVGFTQPTDQTGTGASVLDPRIAPLANNGGPTSTHALCVAAGVPHASCAGVSPAIDKGDDGSVAPTTDQRGAVRPFDNPLISPAAGGDNSDIGAYEVNNSPPTIVAVPTSRNAGSAVSNSTIANVTDAESGNGGVTVTVNGGATATVNGVTVSNIQNNGTGGITADVVAACGATNASFTLTATDGGSLTATATLNVTVVVVPPTLSYNTPAAIVFGAGTTVNPATGPSDNGSVASIAVQNASSYTGTVSVHNTTGVVTFSNAGPVGTHAIIIRITDNCGTTTDASFNLTVNKADTLTQITGDTPDPSIIGQAYAVTWTVTPVSPGAGTPTGNVTVTDGTGGTCTAPVAAGTCNVTSTSAGVKTLVATYSGDASFNGSTSPGVSHTVNLQITGTIRQYPAMTGLANVTVRLLQMPGATTLATTTTNASGVYTFAGVFAGNVAVVPDTTTPAPGRQYDPLSRSYNAIVNNITGADFTAYNSLSDVPRTLNLTTQYVVPGAAGTMPVILNSQDNEAQVSFTIIYDINPFAQPPTFVCGTNAPGCTLTTDTSVLGRVGVTITPAGGAFSMADGVPEAGTPEIPQTPGPKEIARMNFQTLANNLPSTPINFTATPVNTIARDAANNPLLLNAINGLIVFAQGNESDVSTRNAGNGTIDSTDVVQIRRFVTGLDTPVANFNEFQRADVAPAASRGNGQIDATDVIQTRRYATGLDAPQSAAGPGAANPGPVAPPVEEAGTAAVGSRSSSREIRLGSSNAATNSRVAIPVEIIANGDEMAMSFTVRYDHTKLGDPTVQTANTPDGATLTTNTDEPGVIRVLLDAATPFARSNTKDANTIFNIAFDVSAKAPTGDTTIELENVVISDATANSLNTKTTNGRISIAGPNALGVEISGRVMTPTGQGLRNATVTIRDANGQSRTATTGTFGFYRFEGLTPGDQYTVTISSRTYRFTPRRLQAADNLTGIDFTAKE